MDAYRLPLSQHLHNPEESQMPRFTTGMWLDGVGKQGPDEKRTAEKSKTEGNEHDLWNPTDLSLNFA